jgi:hypothetical protein
MDAYKFPDEKEPVEQEIELELDSADSEVEIVDDTPAQDRNRKPLAHEVEEPSEDELNEYSSKVQKRLKELTHARHDERRKAEVLSREKAELERVAKLMADENKRLNEYVSLGQTAYIDKSKSLATYGMNAAKAKMKAALDAGDTEAAVAAQEELLNAQLEMQQVNNFKPQQLQKPQNDVYTQPITRQPEPKLDTRVVSWAEKNPWFEKPGDEDMTGFAYGVHNKLVREYGEEYTRTDEYYQKIDTAMRKSFPERFDDVEDAPKASRPKSVVAPAQRTSVPKKIRLTTTQQNVAKKLGIPLELYARKMIELENQNG